MTPVQAEALAAARRAAFPFADAVREHSKFRIQAISGGMRRDELAALAVLLAAAVDRTRLKIVLNDTAEELT